MEKQALLNTYVSNVSMKETVKQIEQFISEKKKSYIVAINVDVVVKIEHDPYLKKITDNADMVLVDGKPLVWIAKWEKRPVKEKISGSDLVPLLCTRAAKKGYSIFIIGGKEGIAEKAKKKLEEVHPAINIVGTYAPPFGFEKDEVELQKINEMISEVHPDLLIACFGWDVHDNEREYRICIKRDGKFKDDVRLEIGDISDIAIAVKANEVRQAIDDLLVNRKIQPSIDGYVGTTSREKMRHEFYDMGDGMVNIMLVLGGITEYVKE